MKIDVVGAGGHAKVILALVQAAGHEVGIVAVSDPSQAEPSVLGHKVQGMDVLRADDDRGVMVAIGHNAVRARVADELASRGLRFATLIHPTAWVAPTARIGEGTVIFAGAVVQPDVVIGPHAIINTSASVDHDCVIGAYAHLAPGTHLAGDVHVGERAFLGAGVSVIPGVSIGARSTVGAGAAVVRDIPEDVTAMGVPARVREET